MHGSTEGGMNGGRFIHPSSNTHLSRINTNNSNRNVYSSQQNLSKTNINYHSNFSRNRIYGSQQSLSNSSSSKHYQHAPSNNNFSSNNHQIHNNNNSNTGISATNTTDVWLNAWNTPNPPSGGTTTITATTTHRQSSASSHFNNYNNKNAHINDPWTGDLSFLFYYFF